jgi:hypothetical protein
MVINIPTFHRKVILNCQQLSFSSKTSKEGSDIYVKLKNMIHPEILASLWIKLEPTG